MGTKKMKKITAAKFEEIYMAETGFEMMERDGRTNAEHVRNNIQWFRDWAQETADRLDRIAERVRGFTA